MTALFTAEEIGRYRDDFNAILTALARHNVFKPENLPDAAALASIERLRAAGLYDRLHSVLMAAYDELAGLKPSTRSGATLAGLARRRAGLKQHAPQTRRPAEVAAPSRPDHAVMDKLRGKHLIEAMQALLTHNFDALDPALGDASCEMRPFFLLDLSDRLQGSAADMGLSPPALAEAASRYQQRHRQDNEETGVIADDAADPDEMALWHRLTQALARPDDPVDAADFLALCRGYTVAASLQVDEFALPVASRLRRRHPLSADDAAMERLGRMTCALMAWASARLARWSPSPLLEEVAAVLRQPRGRKQMEGATLPLVPIYEAMRSVLGYEWMAGRPIVLSLIRLARWRQGSRQRFKLLGASPMVLRPDDAGLGQFVTPSDLTPLMRRSCYVFRSFMVMDLDGPGEGLLDPGLTMVEVKRRLAVDPLGYLLAYAAVHPPFADGAETLEPPAGSTRLETPKYGGRVNTPFRLFCEGDLASELAALRALARARGAADVRYTDRDDRNKVRRLAATLDFAPIHIHAGTPVTEIARLSKLAAAVENLLVGDRYDLKFKRSEEYRRDLRPVADWNDAVINLVRRA